MKLKHLFFHIYYCNFRQSDQPGARPVLIRRSLSHHEFLFFGRARGSFHMGGRTHVLEDGMLLNILPGVPHVVETEAGAPFTCYSVHFSYVGVNLDEGGWRLDENTGTLPLEAAHVLKDAYLVEDGFKKLFRTWEEKLPGYEFSAGTLFQQLLLTIAQSVNHEPRNYAASLKVESIIRYMHEHLHEKLTMTQLADLAQLSPAYLSRMFKEHTGYSMMEFFNKIKMDKAKEMILEGGRKIKEVARALGFADEFYFSRVFKKTEGISPSEFYSRNVHGV